MAAFVPYHKYDIFISYAHVDNEPAPGAEEGWVSTLVKGLRIILAQKVGRRDAFSLWMDYQLSPHEPLTHDIIEAVEHTAILVIILSPGYLSSEWCQSERNAFLKIVGERPRSEARVFIVERDKIEESERPVELRDLLGYRFWVKEREGRPPRILGEPKPNPGDPKCQPYFDQLHDLGHDLAEELKRLRSVAEIPDAEKKEAETPSIKMEGLDTSPAVFLAEVTDDLIIQRDEVRRYLNQAGLKVLPATPLYFSEPEVFQKAVGRDLEKCTLFVQMLSSLSGRRSAEQPSYTRLQYEAASKSGKPILQWRSPSLDLNTIVDQDYRQLLEEETVLAVGLEEFKREVVNCALCKPVTKISPVCTLVFLDVNSEDNSLAKEIIRVMEKHNIGYVLPLQQGKPSEIRNDLEKCLLESDGIIVVYGAVTPVWAREQLLYCRKIMYKREQPIKAIAIYEGPPEEKDPLNIALPGMQIIKCRRRCLLERELQAFFDALNASV